MEKVLWLMEVVKSGFEASVLAISPWTMDAPRLGRPVEVDNNQIETQNNQWLYHPEGSQHTQNIQTNKILGENEKMCLLFYEISGKNHMDFLANPIHR